MSIVEDVVAVLAASPAAELRALVEQTPRLHGDEVGDALRLVADNARAEGDTELADHAVVVAALLRRCQLVGTAEAFAEAEGRPTGVEQAWVAALAARDAGQTDAAEAAWRRVLSLLPADAERPVPLARVDALSALGAVQLGRYRDGTGSRHLDQAVLLFSHAVAEAEAADRADHRNNLGAALMARYDLRGDRVDVDTAITAFTASTEDAHASTPTRTFGRTGLGSALLARFEVAGQPADLDAAITHLQAALDASGTEPDGEVMGNLGLGLLTRYEAAGDQTDLRQAVAAFRDALASWPAEAAEWANASANLGHALLASYEADGDAAVLEEAVTIIERAIGSPGSDPVDLPAFRNTLGACLMARFERTGELDVLDRAVTTFQRAVQDTDPAAPERAIYVDSLAGGRLERFVRRGDPADVHAAVAAAESALRMTEPAAPERPRRLATLANCLATDPAASMSDVGAERIVACYAEAQRLAPVDSPEWWLYATGYASGLLDRYGHHHDPDDLDGAVRGYRDALAKAPDGAGGMSALHYNLAGALDLRHERTNEDRDHTAVLAELAHACRLGADRTPDVALLAGRDLGDRLAGRGQWSQATDAYATAVTAMRRLVRAQAVRTDREIRLQNVGRLTANATLSAVRSDRRDDAVTLLDQGRALLLSLVLERERTDLSRLQDLGEADLAGRYQHAAVRVSRLELGARTAPGAAPTVTVPARRR